MVSCRADRCSLLFVVDTMITCDLNGQSIRTSVMSAHTLLALLHLLSHEPEHWIAHHTTSFVLWRSIDVAIVLYQLQQLAFFKLNRLLPSMPIWLVLNVIVKLFWQERLHWWRHPCPRSFLHSTSALRTSTSLLAGLSNDNLHIAQMTH